MRFSIKDLLVIVAFVAVISWCAGQIGVGNASLWIVFIAMTVTATAFVAAAKFKQGRWLAAFIPGITLFPICLMVFSPGAFVYAVLLFAGGVASLLLRPMPTKVLCAFVMVCMATALIVDAREVQGRVRNLEAMRQEFPIVSLVNRLAYERRDELKAEAMAETDASFSGEVSIRLSAFEQDLADVTDMNRREWSLKTIHDREYDRFVRSMGFGVMRMRRPWLDEMRRPPLRDIAFNQGASEHFTRTDRMFEWDAGLLSDTPNMLERLHQIGRIDFLDPNGFGAVLEPNKVAGFIEHAMHFPPVEGLKDRDAWRIERLELVSLLKFDEPRVYVLDHLPRMDQLSGDDVPTRSLDEFEKESLDKLRTDEDLVVAEQDGLHRMLGSLRAAKQCLDCHSVERGELLGAFSYRLNRGEKRELETSAPIN